MTNVTFAVPAEIYQKMKMHPEIKWGEVARQAIAEYLKKQDDDKGLRMYTYKKAAKDWTEASDLFEF